MAKLKSQLVSARENLGEAIPLGTPYVVYVEASSFCNLACRFCPHFIDPTQIKKKNMSFEIFQKLCDDLSDFPNKLKLLRFCGLGDSLVNKAFPDFVKLARIRDVADKLELISNGLLLRPELMEILAANLDRIIISIEGLTSDDYLKFTNRKVDIEKFKEKLKFLFNIKNRRAKIHLKIHNSAIKDDRAKREFFDIFGRISDEIYIENLINLWPEVESNLGLDVGHRFINSRYRDANVCAQIFKSLQVNSDGSVFPCCIDWKGINLLGNISEDSLSDIWNCEELFRLRMLHLNGGKDTHAPCAGCSMNELSDIDYLDPYVDTIKAKILRLSNSKMP